VRHALAGLLASTAACEVYDSPPKPNLLGAEENVLLDPEVLEIGFAEPIDPSTLHVKVVTLTTDPEGNLADEDVDPLALLGAPATALEPLYAFDAGVDTGGTSVFAEDDSAIRIVPDKPFPVGPKLAVLVEPGLADPQGNTVEARVRLPFSYAFTCAGTGSQVFQTGVYFFLLQVEEPIGVQVQLFADFHVDPATGHFVGMATNADRDKSQVCPMSCDPETEVCRLLPTPMCVAPSIPAATFDEYPDYVPNTIPPTGFSFVIQGCAEDQSGTVAGLVTLPGDMIVESPPVTVQGLVMTASFTLGADSIVRGDGSITAAQVLILEEPSGVGVGTITGRLIPPGEVPPGVPPPPAE